MVIRIYAKAFLFILLSVAGYNVQAQNGPPPVPNFFCDSSGFEGSYGPYTSIDYTNMKLSIEVWNNYKQHINSTVSIAYYSDSIIVIQPQTLSYPLIDTGSSTFVFDIDSLIPSDSVDRTDFYVSITIQSTTDSRNCTTDFWMRYGSKPHFPPYEMCDYISLDSVELTSSSISLYIKNNSTFVVTSPKVLGVNANRPDIRFEADSIYQGLWFDTLGGVNNGITKLSVPVYYLKDSDPQPPNPLLNFRFWVSDSTGTIFSCPFDFNVRYEKEDIVLSDGALIEAGKLYCTSNSQQLTVYGDIGDAAISIYNTTGQLLYQQFASTAPLIIPINELPAGLYFAVVKKGEEMVVRKFIR